MSEQAPAAHDPNSRAGMARHAARFGIVGVINTGVYYGLYLLFQMVMPYLAAHLLATFIAMVGSFFMNCYFTFQTKPTWKKFAIFPLTNLTNYVVQTVGVVVLVEWARMDQRIAPLVAAVVAIPITFFLSRKILLERDPKERIAEVMTEDEPEEPAAREPRP